MASFDELRALSDFLRSPIPSSALPEERQQELILRGIVALLEEAAADLSAIRTEDRLLATGALSDTASGHAHPGVRGQAYQALERLARAGSQPAADALYRLSIEDGRLAARQFIISENLHPATPSLRALFDWFTGLETGKPFPADNLFLLTEGYFYEASPALQRRVIATAVQNRMENWARIISAVQNGSQEALLEIVERYPSFSPEERQLTLEQLDRLAALGSPAARDALSQLFIRHEDPYARDLVLAHEYLPDDSQQRALFFFLAEAWNPYENLDFDHNLLLNAYESAGRSLRRKLLEHSRRTGQMEWLRGAESANQVRWLSDLTDADWELAERRLLEQEKFDDLWRLAQLAPPLWSAAILDQLDKRGWAPGKGTSTGDERTGYEKLIAMARACLESPLALRPKKTLQAPAELASLALHPAGRLLAGGAGGSDQRIFLWDLPDGNPRSSIIGPAPVNRALAFSPDGELLAAAAGDHRIRVFRLQGGQVIKTLEGHRAMVRSLAIHPDGRTIYSASFDGSLRFWRFPFGPELMVIQPGPGEIFSMAQAAGGSHLISGGADCLVHLWTLPGGIEARELAAHLDTITLVTASPVSEMVASAGRDGAIRVWNYSSGGLLRTIQNPGAPLTALCLHPNDQVLIGGRSNGEITYWNISTGRIIDQVSIHRKPVIGLVLSPEGDSLYSAGTGGDVSIWDLRTLLMIRLPGEVSRPGAANELQERLKNTYHSSSEKKWLTFAAELARWRQRFDIELVEFDTIQIGEFDIEL